MQTQQIEVGGVCVILYSVKVIHKTGRSKALELDYYLPAKHSGLVRKESRVNLSGTIKCCSAIAMFLCYQTLRPIST